MGKFVDLTGMKFGRWEVLKRVENKGKNTMYLCKCSCKKQTERKKAEINCFMFFILIIM